MDPKSFPEWQKASLTSLVSTTKLSTALGARDVDFERSIDSSIDVALQECSDQLLNLLNRLLKFAGGLSLEEFDDEEGIEFRWAEIVDVIDFVLEQADNNLDEYNGATKRGSQIVQGTPYVAKVLKTGKQREKLEYNLFHAANIARPQLKFRRTPDNSETTPWRPLLTQKPHAIIPIDQSLITDETMEENQDVSLHPYQYEIVHSTYPRSLYDNSVPPIGFQSFEDTSATWVDNIAALEAMLDELKQAQEIAVDLEHHDYRSFHGFVCLMQISSREKDWIVDTLELREELEALNEIFADPKIVKVLHGASMDVVWLQRDFGLYIVSLFDTYFAAVALQLPGKSLAYLLSKYANFDADKKYQLADWRIRPLPAEMLAYARSDTHYLLYIYDRLRKDVAQHSQSVGRNLLEEVLDSSRQLALTRYYKERYDEEGGRGSDGWKNILMKNRYALHSPLQLAVFKKLHRWRDQIAREDDESVNFVLPNRSLFALAQSLPHNMQAVIAACKPTPPLIQIHAEDIARIVKKTREEAEAATNGANLAVSEDVKQMNEKSSTNPITHGTHIWLSDTSSRPESKDKERERVYNIWDEEKHIERLGRLKLQDSSFWRSIGKSLPPNPKLRPSELILSAPLPSLSAIPFMSAEDVEAELENKPDVTSNGDNVASLADHPFVQRSMEDSERRQLQQKNREVIILSQLGPKRKIPSEKKRLREEEAGESEHGSNESSLAGDLDEGGVRPSKRQKKRNRTKKIKPKETATPREPVVQLDPYRIVDSQKDHGSSAISRTGVFLSGKSKTFPKNRSR